jgi:hypothetical protein
VTSLPKVNTLWMPLIHSSLFVEMGSCSGGHPSLQQKKIHLVNLRWFLLLHQLAMAIEWIIILTYPSKVVAGLSRQTKGPLKYQFTWFWNVVFFPRLCHPGQPISFDFFSKQGTTTRTWSYKLLVFMGCPVQHNSKKLLWKLGAVVNCPPTTSAPIWIRWHLHRH